MSSEENLIQRAKDVRANAYAPYSKFAVGAAILDQAGAIHIGCNVENAAYPTGSCAEENAIGAMIAAGGKHIHMIAVIGGPEGETGSEACQPCGACRQRIAEFSVSDTQIVLQNSDGTMKQYTIDELLPDRFTL